MAKLSQHTGNQTVYDYLALPSQRVGRYTMYFKELLKHTTDDHPDLTGLHTSLIKIEEIANIREDKHTQLMKIFHQLLQAIQFCPVNYTYLLYQSHIYILIPSLGVFDQFSTSIDRIFGHNGN